MAQTNSSSLNSIFVKIYLLLNSHALKLSIVISVIVFLIFYPKTYVAVDEFDYLYNSKNIVDRTIKQTCISDGYAQFEVEDYCIYKTNIGTSLFFIPAVLTNMNLAFGITFAVFICGMIVFKKLLDHHGMPGIYLFLFTFYPAFVYYSRTLYSEIFSITAVLTAIYTLEKFVDKNSVKHGLLSGAFWGISVLIKYTNVFILVPYLLIYLIKSWKKTKKLSVHIFSVFIGAFPFLLFFLWINNYLYGAPFRSGYYYSGEEWLIELGNLPLSFIKYSIVLSLLYPLMTVTTMYLKKYQKLSLYFALALLFIIYGGFPGDNQVIEGRVLDVIFGQRYFLSLVPILILSFATFMNKFQKKKYFKIVLIIGVCLLGINAILLNVIHQKFLISYPPINQENLSYKKTYN